MSDGPGEERVTLRKCRVHGWIAEEHAAPTKFGADFNYCVLCHPKGTNGEITEDIPFQHPATFQRIPQGDEPSLRERLEGQRVAERIAVRLEREVRDYWRWFNEAEAQHGKGFVSKSGHLEAERKQKDAEALRSLLTESQSDER